MNTLQIFGTLGPSCHTKETIRSMLQMGMTGLRLNLSHVNLKDCTEWIQNFQDACQLENKPVNLLIDIKGPELRIKKELQPVELKAGQTVDVTSLSFPELIYKHLQKGQTILLDDGRIQLEMLEGTKAKVIHPGILKPSKSLALPGCTIQSPTLTKEDIENLKVAKDYGVTGIMQPFVRNKDDLIFLRQTMDQYNLKDCKIYAKIENKNGVDQLESLFPYCDEIIIARGDLANSVGLIHIAKVQQEIEERCHQHNMPYMVVTEMLHSMIQNPTPTRSEVMDIYTAVKNGAHSIMLTAETAAGNYPLEAMSYFTQIAKNV